MFKIRGWRGFTDAAGGLRRLHQRARRGAVLKAVAASGAALGIDLIQMADFEVARMNRGLGADLSAQPARVATRLLDRDLHTRPWKKPSTQSSVCSTGSWVSGVEQ